MKDKYLELDKKFVNTYAFTLVELMIVFSIIGVLFSVGVAYYQKFNRKQALIQTAKNLKNDLRVVQSKALSGEKDCSISKCGGTTEGCGNDTNGSEIDLTGWSITLSTTGYEYHGYCNAKTFGSKTVTFPEGVSLDQGSGTYHFFPLGYTISDDLLICLKDNESTYKLIVSKGGEIKDSNQASTGCQ